jgi:1,4-alpha-glucan branching enzyme
MIRQLPPDSDVEVYNFVVVCREAQKVFVVGDFNRWSASATPMQETERDVWQLSLDLPRGNHHFSYFIIDSRFRTRQAPFADAYLLPGTWATVVRSTSRIFQPA